MTLGITILGISIECHYAERRYAELLSVVMMSVVAPFLGIIDSLKISNLKDLTKIITIKVVGPVDDAK